MSTELGLSYGG